MQRMASAKMAVTVPPEAPVLTARTARTAGRASCCRPARCRPASRRRPARRRHSTALSPPRRRRLTRRRRAPRRRRRAPRRHQHHHPCRRLRPRPCRLHLLPRFPPTQPSYWDAKECTHLGRSEKILTLIFQTTITMTVRVQAVMSAHLFAAIILTEENRQKGLHPGFQTFIRAFGGCNAARTREHSTALSPPRRRHLCAIPERDPWLIHT